ncbi:DUF4185 domain-containing protein [Propionicimonas sp.]|uniref:DUF4185 domain-containing protein n=1 Tax=Propionicimonas sp. TaxID=1955623 RepID=UPI00183BC677|nr:DUF4185 domain-containing protein [Propionicimonas sp.]MBU3976616.1 DUF4185 domain-containing protein [Actinomycetota bacterium]MBA3020384.1 DUF4185 domain-containing protein [Propionicimonas sp.]MBU3986557.1 DUF4185 domain-containing protein [Actinomycetota bacterium]MBU4007291.1 DUF4185 domain-containing protein [Actinomycetota bacterium]MBU4065044.1 DUF4185 domain-containing protein [Actinomycetota bacterium]
MADAAELAAITDASLIPGRGWTRRLEAVVFDGVTLVHYRRRLDRPDRPWIRMGAVSDAATGPGELTWIGGRLHCRVLEAAGALTYRLTSDGWQPTSDRPWQPPPRQQLSLTAEVADAVGLLRAASVCERTWPQALVDEAGSIFGYQRRPDGRWQRSSCLRLADPQFADATNSSVKLAQVTGDRDATVTPWGERLPTLSRSRATAGIRGTDLGVRFEHEGRSFLLFGDTHWTRPWLVLRDSIAEVFDDEPLPTVRFHGSPLQLRGGGATMGEYDVPLDAFSHQGELYGLFSSNHNQHRQTMGRSILARCVDPGLAPDPKRRHRPIRFQALATLSDWHFINVSVQLRPAAEVPGCGREGEVLLLWGTGSYRASEIRLAMLDAAGLARLSRLSGPVATAELGLRYWDGGGWSDDELAAAPLFRPGAFGELSVRWIPAAGRYALLTATGPEDPAGNAITLRWADQPAGPWTSRLRLLDWVAKGMSPDPFTRFIKASHDDQVAEAIFPAQAKGNGAAYAPYLFDSRLEADELVLRYTLSTWNPYQVVLLEHRLVPGEF